MSAESIRKAKATGGARSELIDRVRQLTTECRQGRAASACMSEMVIALDRYDARQPQKQNEGN